MTATDDTRQERRSEPRRRVLRGATVRFNKGYGALECVMRNESPNGALLVFGETAAVPNSFDLYITGQENPRHAHVRWRTTTALGIQFV